MTIKKFVERYRLTLLYISFLLFGIVCLATQSITEYLLTFRSFFIYFFSYTYKPIYSIVNFPLKVVNKFIVIPYLFDENIKLKEKIKVLYSKNLQYQNIISKMDTSIVERLRRDLSYELVNSEVIMREYKEWYNECIAVVSNKEKNFIKEDAPIICYTGEDKFYLVGRVWEIKENIIKVLLITNPLSVIPVKVKNKQIYGVVVGNNSPVLTMDYILLEDDIKIGDTIVTSGLNNFPEGIEIGYVVNVELSTTGFKKATVKLNFNINAIKNLLILVSKTGS